MSIKTCFLRALIKTKGAHEYWRNSKTLGGVQKNKRGCVFGALSGAILAYKPPQVEDGCDEYQNLYFTSSSHKTKGAHEYWHNSKMLGGVQKNKRGCNLGALSEAILALHTSSGWGPAPALPDPYPLKKGPA